MRRAMLLLSASLFSLAAGAASAAETATPHNVILFVPDGLRSLIVKPDTAPDQSQPRL